MGFSVLCFCFCSNDRSQSAEVLTLPVISFDCFSMPSCEFI